LDCIILETASVMKITKINSLSTTKVLFAIFIIVAMVLNVVFFILFKYQKNLYKYELINSKQRLVTLESFNENYRDMILNNIGSESSQINPSLILTNAITNTKTSMQEIAKDSPILILRFTEYSCHACVEQSFKTINNIPHPFRKGKFIIIASYESLRALLLFKADNNINYSIYTLKNNDSLNVPLESLNFPYFFILNGESEATSIFYPLTSDPELTNDYFVIVRYKYPMLFR